MPFTLSHPALVLPLRRTGLPMAGLVCGSMAPDLHMVVPRLSDDRTHAWSGVPTYDVALGLGALLLWTFVVAPPFEAALPDAVRARVRQRPRYGPVGWAMTVVAVVIGAATHVGWDTFTHQEMWGGQHVPWLYEIHHGYPGYHISQYVSSIVGLVVVGAYLLWTLRDRRPRPVDPHPFAHSARLALLVPLGAALVLGALASLQAMLYGWGGLDFALASGLRTVLVASAVGIVIGCLVWNAVRLNELAVH